MKLGNGKIKYKFSYVYKNTNIKANKNVYADNKEEAIELFNEYIKNYEVKDVKVEE